MKLAVLASLALIACGARPPIRVDPRCYSAETWRQSSSALYADQVRCAPGLERRCRDGDDESCAQLAIATYQATYPVDGGSRVTSARGADVRRLVGDRMAKRWAAACAAGQGRACALLITIDVRIEAARRAAIETYWLQTEDEWVFRIFDLLRAEAEDDANVSGCVDLDAVACERIGNHDTALWSRTQRCAAGHRTDCDEVTRLATVDPSAAERWASEWIATPAFARTSDRLLFDCGRGHEDSCRAVNAVIAALQRAGRGGELPRLRKAGCYYGAIVGACQDLCAQGDATACMTGCTRNDRGSCERLAAALRKGANLRQDPALAAAIAERGCAAGSAPSCEQIASQALAGEGVAADARAAAAWYALACKGGSASGCASARALPSTPARQPESCDFLRKWPNVVFYRACNGPHEHTFYSFKLPCTESDGRPGIAEGSATAYVCFAQVRAAIDAGGSVSIADERVRAAIPAAATGPTETERVARELQRRLAEHQQRLEEAFRSCADACCRAQRFCNLHGCNVMPAC